MTLPLLFILSLRSILFHQIQIVDREYRWVDREYVDPPLCYSSNSCLRAIRLIFNNVHWTDVCDTCLSNGSYSSILLSHKLWVIMKLLGSSWGCKITGWMPLYFLSFVFCHCRCGESDHIARNCPQGGDSGGAGAGGGGSRRCYNCNEVGHLSRDCTVNV